MQRMKGMGEGTEYGIPDQGASYTPHIHTYDVWEGGK